MPFHSLSISASISRPHPYLSLILSNVLSGECIKINVSQHRRRAIKIKIPNVLWRERHKGGCWSWEWRTQAVRKEKSVVPTAQKLPKVQLQVHGGVSGASQGRNILIFHLRLNLSPNIMEREGRLVGSGVRSHIEFWRYKWMFENCRAGGALEVMRGQ